MAGWLEELARANSFFKSHRSIEHAVSRSEELSHHYVDEHKRHFFYTFGQLIGFLALYAVASAALLGLGGWLVISGELTLGQLVAASSGSSSTWRAEPSLHPGSPLLFARPGHGGW